MNIHFLNNNELESYIYRKFNSFNDFTFALTNNEKIGDIILINNSLYQISMVGYDKNYWVSIDSNVEFTIMDETKEIEDNFIGEISSLQHESTYYFTNEKGLETLSNFYGHNSEEYQEIKKQYEKEINN